MAKNFGKAGIARKINEVQKLSAEKAQVITLQMVNTENLVDYSKNGEDIEDTLDIENSIKEIGFTDPIEVTGYGMEDGKYMIVSGHRRRAAGVKTGMELFPCIIRNFNSEDEIRNYVLLSNSQRDSAKDPLLFVKRYRMHEEYLKESGFTGSIREEVAKRLGISVQQADRYKQFNKIIMPVWDLVRNEEIGMSSVLPMATHTLEEQAEIYDIIVECILSLEDGEKPNRKMVKMIIDNYRNGAKTWNDIVSIKEPIEEVAGMSKNPHGEETMKVDDYEVSTDNTDAENQKLDVPSYDIKINVPDDVENDMSSEEQNLSSDSADYEIGNLKRDFMQNIDEMKQIIEKFEENPKFKAINIGDKTLEEIMKTKISPYFDEIQEFIDLLNMI